MKRHGHCWQQFFQYAKGYLQCSHPQFPQLLVRSLEAARSGLLTKIDFFEPGEAQVPTNGGESHRWKPYPSYRQARG